MGKTWEILISIVLFLIITFLYWIMTSGYIEKEYGKKMWKQWGRELFIGMEHYLLVGELQL